MTLYGMTFMDATTGWAVGGSGSIRHTTNGGTAWAAQTSGTTQTLHGIVSPAAAPGPAAAAETC